MRPRVGARVVTRRFAERVLTNKTIASATVRAVDGRSGPAHAVEELSFTDGSRLRFVAIETEKRYVTEAIWIPRIEQEDA